MASHAQLIQIKRIAPPGDFTDAELGTLIDAKGINGAAADLWATEASATASLVDITESGSSRKNSQAHDKAKAMLELYTGLHTAEIAAAGDTRPTARTRRLTR